MRQMKASGNVWYGKIPQNWETKRLKYFFKFCKGLPITKDNLIDQGLPVISYGQIHAKTNNGVDVRPHLLRFVDFSYQTFYPLSQVMRGDFVFADTSEDYDGCGNCVYKRNDSLLFAGYHTIIAHSIIESDNRFFAYLFLTDIWRRQIREKVFGVKVFSITQKTLSNSYIILPPLAEQQRIADYLDSECGKIDGLKADIQAQIDTLEQYKRSVITEAVTHGLHPSAPMKECSVSWARQIPQHWKVMPNKHLMTKIKNICPIYRGEDILSLTMYGVIVRDLDAGGKMPSSFDGYQYIKKGNLLMCLFDIDVTPRCIGIIKQNGITSPAYSQFKMRKIANARFYYYYYLMLDYTKELLHLAKNLRHSLTEDQLGSIKQLVPPLDEQQEIADYLDNKCAEIEQIIADKKSQIETLENYKKSLIYEYVTGKKEVV